MYSLNLVRFAIFTTTCIDYWTLLSGYLTYLLNISFEYVYIILYLLKWLFWCVFYMWNDIADGYPISAWNPMGTGTNV
jgi:hypothetical protein